MLIKSARFAVSSPEVKNCPKPVFPEYAFIGRSNVGKSSLINMLVQQKGMAKTSSTPGKTQLINHFLVNENWYLVDLPGYGFSKTGKDKAAGFGKMISDYILQRENLMNLFVLIDSRLPMQKADESFFLWLGENQVPFSIVFTKADKSGRSTLNTNLANYRKKLLDYWEELPLVYITSVTTQTGRDELLNSIEEMNKNFKPY
ncbi:MAG: putative GTP-binding protein EngB [Bacteroidia bacterium]|nr:putative GTP-binding protein EngB [Bacteroidia bacterium]